MGQQLSALKKHRAIRKDAQQSKKDSPFNSTEAADDLLSISTESTSEDSLFNLSLECEEGPTNFVEPPTEISLALECEKRTTKLNDLPAEVLLDIAGYLAPSGQLSLSYSCRQIQQRMNTSLARTLGQEEPMAPLSIESRNLRSLECSEIRSMLERDGKIAPLVKFCVGCEAVHNGSGFAISSLTQANTEHRCLGTTGRVWICPHDTFGYDQAVKLTTKRESHFCENGFISFHIGHSWRYSSFEFGYSTTWPIMNVPRECVPSKEQVKEALAPLNAPVCPHLRLNDARIANMYIPGCQRLREVLSTPRPECKCRSCSSQWRRNTVCDFCGTGILFRISRYAISDIEALDVWLWRSLIQDIPSPTDRSWICQVADPADFEAYEKAWRATSAECWKRVGSVHSIRY